MESGLASVTKRLFYYDDVCSYFYPPSDLIWQAHEGDWEAVNVVLPADGEPAVVGYSQHCLGTGRSWAGTPRWEDTHPIVHVAIGSHANYSSAGSHAFNPACVPVPVQFLALLGLGLPVDCTGEGAIVGPPRSGGLGTHGLRIGDVVPGWTRFDGFWGQQQFFHAAPVGTLPFGTSPRRPVYDTLWSDPLGTLATWPLG